MSDLQKQLQKKKISHSSFKLPNLPSNSTKHSLDFSLQAPAVLGKPQAPFCQDFDEMHRDGYRSPSHDDGADEDAETDDYFTELGCKSSVKRVSRFNTEPIETKPWCDFFDENFQVLYNDVNNHENGAFNVFFSSPQSIDAPIFIFHHGAGSGALSFALLVKRLQGLMKREKETSDDTTSTYPRFMLPDNDLAVAGAIAFDARGHGATTLGNNVPEATIDYSLDTLTEDFLFLLSSVAKRQKWDELASPPKLIFVGHSLGGAVVTNAALKLKQAGLVSLSSSSVFRNIIGLVVLDVVEGSAIEALQSMNQILSTRPAKFDNINDAIEWHLRTRTLRNKESASVSVPGILKPIIEGSIPSKSLTWITDLKKTEQFWKQWFFGLSSKFLQAPAAKLLILAGTDRLDKDLMIGQMQGKYQLIVFQDSGHFLHEDNPTKTALALIDFFKRNDRSGITTIPVFGKFNKQ